MTHVGCEINPNLSMSIYSVLTAQPTYWAGIFLDTAVIQSKCIMRTPLCAQLYRCKIFPRRKDAKSITQTPALSQLLRFKKFELDLQRKSNESFVLVLKREQMLLLVLCRTAKWIGRSYHSICAWDFVTQLNWEENEKTEDSLGAPERCINFAFSRSLSEGKQA